MKRLILILLVLALWTGTTADAPVYAAGSWTDMSAVIEWIRGASDVDLTTFLNAVATISPGQAWINAVESQMFPEPANDEKLQILATAIKVMTPLKDDTSAEATAAKDAIRAYWQSLQE